MPKLAFLAALLIGVNAAQAAFYDPVTPDSGPAPQFGAYVLIDHDRGISVTLKSMTLGRAELTFLNALYKFNGVDEFLFIDGRSALIVIATGEGVDEVIERFADTAGTAFLDDILPRLVDLNDFDRRPFTVSDGAGEPLFFFTRP